MCERKPGLRCSADTLAKLSTARANLATAIQAVNEMDAYTEGMVYDDLELMYDETTALDHELTVAEHKVYKAELMFNATPDGLKDLEAKSRLDGSVYEEKSYMVEKQDLSDGRMDEVAAKIRTNALAKVYLDSSSRMAGKGLQNVSRGRKD